MKFKITPYKKTAVRGVILNSLWGNFELSKMIHFCAAILVLYCHLSVITHRICLLVLGNPC